jgi:predicted metal-dependent hydrolase
MAHALVTFHQLDDISYTVHRRRRRTLALQISADGRVQVLAPRYAFGWIVNRFVQERLDWVRHKLDLFRERRRQFPPKRFEPGECFHLWGNPVTLALIRPGEPASELAEAGVLPLALPEDRREAAEIRKALRRFYKECLSAALPEILSAWAARLDVRVGSVTIADQKRRWGSCAAGGNLRFNWRLATMPRAVVEYVAVHELAHIRVPNHSPDFWRTVEGVMPDFRLHRLWLKRHSLVADF